MFSFVETVQHGIMVHFFLITPGIREKSFEQFCDLDSETIMS